MQKMNTSPHHTTIFCYDAGQLNWDTAGLWDVRMEIRCQEGHWQERMEGFRSEEDMNEGYGSSADEEVSERRRRDGDHETAETEERGKGHKHGDESNTNPEDGIQAFGMDGNVWHYRPRFFYCKSNYLVWLLFLII